MAYDPTLATTKDKVRFLIGDTGTIPVISDAEIAGSIVMVGDNPYDAAIFVCRALSAKYAKMTDISIDSFHVSSSQKSKNYSDLAGQLEVAKAASPGALGAPVLTGISLSEMTSVESDPDRTPSRTRIGFGEPAGILTPPDYTGNDVIGGE